MSEDAQQVQAKVLRAETTLEALADKWAAEVNLTTMIKNAVSPQWDLIGMHRTARMEVQIDAIVRQAFIEGAYRAITGLQDERAEMARLKRRQKTRKRVA